MSESIVVALITGLISFGGTVLTVFASSRKQTQEIMKNQAVMSEQIKNLADDVRKHNAFGERIPVLADRLERAERDIEELKKGA